MLPYLERSIPTVLFYVTVSRTKAKLISSQSYAKLKFSDSCSEPKSTKFILQWQRKKQSKQNARRQNGAAN